MNIIATATVIDGATLAAEDRGDNATTRFTGRYAVGRLTPDWARFAHHVTLYRTRSEAVDAVDNALFRA